MNEHRKEMFITKIFNKLFHTLSEKNICIFGFAFKKDTMDTRYDYYFKFIIINNNFYH